MNQLIGVLTRREVGARLLAPLVAALAREFGEGRVLRVIRETVREAARVTRPGGIFAVYDFSGSPGMSRFQRYHRWFDARHNGEPYSQDFCDCDFDALLRESGFEVDAQSLAKRSGGAGYMAHWFATRV